MNVKAMIVGAVLASAVPAIGGAAYWIGDDYLSVRHEVASNTTDRLIREFERLELIRKQRRLTIQEHIKWCSSGMRLGVFKECPAR